MGIIRGQALLNIPVRRSVEVPTGNAGNVEINEGCINLTAVAQGTLVGFGDGSEYPEFGSVSGQLGNVDFSAVMISYSPFTESYFFIVSFNGDVFENLMGRYAFLEGKGFFAFDDATFTEYPSGVSEYVWPASELTVGSYQFCVYDEIPTEQATETATATEQLTEQPTETTTATEQLTEQPTETATATEQVTESATATEQLPEETTEVIPSGPPALLLSSIDELKGKEYLLLSGQTEPNGKLLLSEAATEETTG